MAIQSGISIQQAFFVGGHYFLLMDILSGQQFST